MVKKLAALAGAGALLLGMAGPAFGWYLFSKDVAIVKNSASAVADTGMNSQSNVADVKHGGGVNVYGASGNRTIYTGDANAYAGALVVANTHIGCGVCDGDGFEGVYHKDFAWVTNSAGAGAYSGGNFQDDLALVYHGGGVNVYGGAGARYVSTGDADSTARAWTIVNTHWGD